MAARKNPLVQALPWACLFALSACGSASREEATASPQASENGTEQPAATAAPSSQSLPPAEPLSCADEIGATAAQKRADLCRNVSPATHPPCNIANSCAMIEDEIARSCALFDSKGDPMPECAVDPRSKEAAAAVVERYYSALNARDYGTAWQQWGDNGPPNQTLEKFQAGFTHTRSTQVAIGNLEPGDAGAGSIYQPVPVTVDATLDDGTHQRFRGTYTVRRVNDVDGASASQRRWHIDSAQLTPVR
jgi:hypothetical protein